MQFGLIPLFDFFSDRQTEVAYYRDTPEPRLKEGIARNRAYKQQPCGNIR